MTPTQTRLVAEAVPIARGIARRLAGRVPLDELTGEAFYALAYAANRFDPGRGVPWPGYARMVVRHRLVRFAQTWLRQPVAIGQDDDGPGFPEPEDSRARDPADLVAAREGVRAVRRQLDRKLFRVLWQVHAIGMTKEDVGRRLGCSRQWVTQLERRAMEAVRG